MNSIVDATLVRVLFDDIEYHRILSLLVFHSFLSEQIMQIKEKKPRIKNGVCYGSGDRMRSNLKDGSRLPKNSARCKVYGSIESIKNYISTYLSWNNPRHDLDDYDLYVLEWLIANLHSLGSYVFVNGRTDDHAFPDNLLGSLENRIAKIQSQTGDCMDFLILDDPLLLLLDRIRIEIRELEVNYSTWYFEELPEKDASPHALYIAAVLNRLSAYLFNVIRYEHIGVPERHWQGKITEFKPPV